MFVSGWLHAAGMAFWVVLVFLPVALLIFLGISRVVVELGLVYVYYPVTPYNAVLQVFGTTLVGPSSVTVLSLCALEGTRSTSGESRSLWDCWRPKPLARRSCSGWT